MSVPSRLPASSIVYCPLCLLRRLRSPIRDLFVASVPRTFPGLFSKNYSVKSSDATRAHGRKHARACSMQQQQQQFAPTVRRVLGCCFIRHDCHQCNDGGGDGGARRRSDLLQATNVTDTLLLLANSLHHAAAAMVELVYSIESTCIRIILP